jgi:hypothetical protein
MRKRASVRIERCNPHSLGLAYHDVRNDVARFAAGKIGGRPRVESDDHRLDDAQHIVVAAQQFLEPHEVARRQHVEMVCDDFERMRMVGCRIRQCGELQSQAFPEVAGADSRRVDSVQS